MASPVAARMNDDTAPNLHGGSSSSRLALPQLSLESVVGACNVSSLIELFVELASVSCLAQTISRIWQMTRGAPLDE